MVPTPPPSPSAADRPIGGRVPGGPAPGRAAGWPVAGGWLALAALVQAAALAGVRAGPYVRYAHYPPSGSWPAWALTALGAAAAAVGLGAFRRRDAIARWARGRSPIRVGLFSLAFVGTAAALSRSASAWLGELAFAAAVQTVALGAVALGVAALPEGAGRGIVRRVLGSGEAGGVGGAGRGGVGGAGAVGEAGVRRSPRIDRFAILAAGFATAASLLLSVVAYERHPHVPDEVGYLLHARYFAAGRLTMDAPPVPEAFDVDLMRIEGDRWWSPVPPGWPAVLALGSRLGAPWVVNPVLAGAVVLLSFLLAGRLFDRPTARAVAGLTAASPWLLFLGMSFMGHALTLTLALGAALAAARSREAGGSGAGRGGGAGRAALAGALVGAVSLVRPLDGVAVGLFVGAWLAVDPGGRRLRVVPAIVYGLVAAHVAAIQLLYNLAITGSATEFPLMRYFDRIYGPGANALGFGPDRGFGWTGLDPFPGHDLLDAAINAALNGYALNVELFGWVTGSLVLGAGYLACARLDRRDAGLVAAGLVVIGVYSLYWFAGGPDFGPRYWSLILFPCVALTARGALRLAERAGPRAWIGVAALTASALIVFVPWRAVDKYRDYRGMRPDVRRLAEERGFGRSLVLVRGERHPDYASAAAYLPVDRDADAPVYAWDRNPTIRRRLLEAFGDRPVWIVDGPTVTGDGYRVEAGPLSAEEAGER